MKKISSAHVLTGNPYNILDAAKIYKEWCLFMFPEHFFQDFWTLGAKAMGKCLVFDSSHNPKFQSASKCVHLMQCYKAAPPQF
jgi:hypothetical protein